MILGRVAGTVVSTAKADSLEGARLLLVERVSLPGLEGTGDFAVALDAVGANKGEIVFYVTGSSARMTDASKGKPTDATIAAIVDVVEREGQVVYNKSSGTAGKSPESSS